MKTNKLMGILLFFLMSVFAYAEDTPILDLLNNDDLIQKMDLSANLDSQLSRSDAIVMIDRMRVLVKSGVEQNMEEYYNPFADVPGDAEYLPSLVRLAYYRSISFDANPINKYNDLFNPILFRSFKKFLYILILTFFNNSRTRGQRKIC